MIFLVESFSTMFWWKKAKRISKRGSVLKVRGSCYFCGFIKNSLPNFYFILQIHHGEKTLEFGKLRLSAGKSVTKALILESVNPQYDNRLFIDLQLLNQKNTSSEHVVYKNCFLFLFWHSKQFLFTIYSEFVFFCVRSCKSMNNLLSYCRLID